VVFESHWGLTGQPFPPDPDPACWYETAGHRRAAAYLGQALAQREGIVVLTGEAGIGKTVLIEHLLREADPDEVQIIRMSPNADDRGDLLPQVAARLDSATAAQSRGELIASIERGLRTVARTGRQTVIVIDPADNLSVAAFEELRLLSGLEVAGHALAQIVLLGAPVLRDRLEQDQGLEPLRRRVIATHTLEPMKEREISGYVAHRLMQVGWRGRPDFAEDAFPTLYAETAGVPRQVNLLAGRAMLYAAIAGTDLIDAGTVLAAAGGASPPPRAADRFPPDVPLDARIAELEARLEEQDAALRRLLHLLVECIDAAPAEAVRHRAA
jgi:general secretion pathway protein A